MINAQLLTTVLIAAGIPRPAINVYDGDYDLVVPSDITVDLSRDFGEFLYGQHIEWRENQFDCNKFAKGASFMMDLAWWQTRQADSAVAFGLFGYSGHMLNIAVHLVKEHADPNRLITSLDLRVAFYEPQPAPIKGEMVYRGVCLQEVTLTPAEIRSADTCDFI